MNKITKILVIFSIIFIALLVFAKKSEAAFTDRSLASDAVKFTEKTSDTYFTRNPTTDLLNKSVSTTDKASYKYVGCYCIEDSGGGSGQYTIKNVIDIENNIVTVYYINSNNEKKSASYTDSGVVKLFKQIAYSANKSVKNGETTGKHGKHERRIDSLLALNQNELHNSYHLSTNFKIYTDSTNGAFRYSSSISDSNWNQNWKGRFIFLYSSNNQNQLVFGSRVEASTANLTIKKVDNDWNGTNLENVTFKITGPNNYRKTKTTDSNGEITLKGLTIGKTYTITETKNTNYGYSHTGNIGNSSTTKRITITAGENEVTIKNTKNTGNLKILKTDKDTGNPMSRVQFKIKNSGGKYIRINDLDDDTGTIRVEDSDTNINGGMKYKNKAANGTTFKTDSNGQILIYNLPIGTYTIEEVQAPTGYKKAANKTVTVVRRKSYATKTFSDGGGAIKNGIYEIQAYNGNVVDIPDGADEDTKITVVNHVNNRNNQMFYIKYISTKDAYKIRNLETNEDLALLGSKVRVLSSATNRTHYWKLLSGGSDYYVLKSLYEDAKYYLKNESGILQVKTNDSKPTADKYKFQFNRTVIANTVTIQNEKKIITEDKPSLEITKIASDTGAMQSGVKFTVKNSSGKYVNATGNYTATGYSTTSQEFVTGSNGKITINDIQAGTYTITETYNGNSGYEQNAGKTATVRVDQTGKASITIYNDPKPEDPITLSGRVWLEQYDGKVSIRDDKYGAGDTSVPLPGVTVSLMEGGNLIQRKNNVTGYYQFTDVDRAKVRNGNYSIKFEYDGFVYQAVTPSVDSNEGYKNLSGLGQNEISRTTSNESSDVTIRSKARESMNGRQEIDYMFASVEADDIRKNADDESFDIQYNKNGSVSTFIHNSNDYLISADTARAGYSMGTVYSNLYDKEYYRRLGVEYRAHQAEIREEIRTSRINTAKSQINSERYNAAEAEVRREKEAAIDADENMTDEEKAEAKRNITIRASEVDYVGATDSEGEARARRNGTIPVSDKDVMAQVEIKYGAEVKRGLDEDVGTIITEIPNINFGLYIREQPDVALSADISKTEVSLVAQTDEYSHTYNYGRKISELDTSAIDDKVTVNLKDKYKDKDYQMHIYSSDLYYNKQRGGEDLEVYITYKYALVNEASGLYTKINKIENYYDKNYTIESINGDEDIYSYIEEDYESDGYNKATINVNRNLAPHAKEYITIVYKLNNKAIPEVINGVYTANCFAEISSYTTYSDSGFSVLYAGVDTDSAPGNANLNNKNEFEDDTDFAPPFNIKLKEGRTIKGTVFEDSAIATKLLGTGYDKERVGNGIYDTNENTVEGVTVELLPVDTGEDYEYEEEPPLKDITITGKLTTETIIENREDTSIGTGNITIQTEYSSDDDLAYVKCRAVDETGKRVEGVKLKITNDYKLHTYSTIHQPYYKYTTSSSQDISYSCGFGELRRLFDYETTWDIVIIEIEEVPEGYKMPDDNTRIIDKKQQTVSNMTIQKNATIPVTIYKHYVTVTAKDSDGNPVSGIGIEGYGDRYSYGEWDSSQSYGYGQTDANGKYTFECDEPYWDSNNSGQVVGYNVLDFPEGYRAVSVESTEINSAGQEFVPISLTQNVIAEVKEVKIIADKAYLYQNDSSPTQAKTQTDKKGEYSFVGVIPGNYMLRFTYGNESVICDMNGNPITKIEDNNGVDNYKSTIFRAGKDNEDKFWYRTDTQRLSDAVDTLGYNKGETTGFDIIEYRTEKTETITYENVTSNLDKIEANSKEFEIKLDYDVNTLSDILTNYGDTNMNPFENMDFGIIERPKQILKIKKEIAYVELQLANGQVIISGDPRKDNLKYVKQMPSNDSEKWGNVSIEMDNELLQGSKLTITWGITVDNTKAEIDYKDRNYYIKGIAPTNKENKFKMATVTKLFDYLSNDMTFTTQPDWEKLVTTGEDNDLKNYLNDETLRDTIKNKYNTKVKTSSFSNMKPGEPKTVYLKTSKLLSNSDTLEFSNDVEVVELKERRMQNSETFKYLTPGNYVPGYTLLDEYDIGASNHEEDDDRNVLSITGPTGLNKEYIPYIILGISCLGIFVSGIVLIRKIVLK